MWYSGPLTTNAMYLFSTNGFFLYQGILQYPFFDASMSDIENLAAIGMVAGATDNPSAIAMVTTAVLYIVLVVAGVAFAKRRFNDLNRSGWWVLSFIVPIVNLLATIYVLFFPGTDGDNDFGPAPSANPLGVKILALSMPIIALIGILAAVLIPMFAS